MTSTPLPYRVVLDTSPVVNGVRLESAIISSIGGTEPTLIAKVKLSYHSNPYDVGFTLGEVLPFQFPVLLKDLTKDLPDGQIFVSARQDDATGLITHDFSLQYLPSAFAPPTGKPSLHQSGFRSSEWCGNCFSTEFEWVRWSMPFGFE